LASKRGLKHPKIDIVDLRIPGLVRSMTHPFWRLLDRSRPAPKRSRGRRAGEPASERYPARVPARANVLARSEGLDP
jgi:hypothetical protein